MNKVLKALVQKNIGAGYLYFFIHFVVEVVCFCALSRTFGDRFSLWLIPLVYDFVAFVPQIAIGALCDRFQKINIGAIGAILLAAGFAIFSLTLGTALVYIGLIILCLGNACIHVAGAETTLKVSNGKLSHSAVFVAGGSFGVAIGKLLAKTSLPFWFFSLLAILLIPVILLADAYKNKIAHNQNPCSGFRYHNDKIVTGMIITLAVIVVISRSYMGYSIPTSWNKTATEMVIFYFMMGIGKALGGILSDAFGIRKIAAISTLGAIPFLIFGDQIMIVSIIGVLMFSMTMAITLGLLVSTMPKRPGFAFGITTTSLFVGAVPIFFIGALPFMVNCIIIIITSITCFLIMMRILRK